MIVAPTWDLVIGIFLILGIAFGFMLQRDKVTVTLIAIYVGLVLVSVLSGPAQQFFSGDRSFLTVYVRGTNSPFAIQTAIFLATVALLTARSGISGGEGRGILSPIELFGYSFFNAALMVTIIVSFLPETTRTAILDSSRLASLLTNYQAWLLVIPILLIVVLGAGSKSRS